MASTNSMDSNIYSLSYCETVNENPREIRGNGIGIFARKSRKVVASIPRDLRGLYRYAKFRVILWKRSRKSLTVPDLFHELVDKHPEKTCFYCEDKKWTYRQLDDLSNRVANVFSDMGYQRGDVIALFMESRPEYVAAWLGLSKLGICTALVNFNLRDQPLIHSIQAAKAKALIFGAELLEVTKDVQQAINHDFKYFCWGPVEGIKPAPSLDEILESASTKRPPDIGIKPREPCVYIYTSGTTGLPKPAVISHNRYQFMCVGMFMMMGLRRDDVVYTPLPLYHSAGGCLGIGQAIQNGMTVVIRKKFSASKFWEDCIKYNCTLAQYIGETCRYLLSQPHRPEDTKHNVRLIYGNGLRPQIWKAFVERFNIKDVREFYGATEGNANIVNFSNKVGAVGFISVICPWVYPVTLIRVDETTGEPIRSKNGLCIRCKPGEPGEFVGKIVLNDPFHHFDGYVSKQATQKKLVKDVFRKGDTAFLSGDILVMDDQGYFYFKDRTGDTFRWRGENVATAEVEAVISNVTNFRDCVVYGVEIPGSEGRAGMAAILDIDGTLDIGNLAYGIAKALPAYARPVFVRLTSLIKMTGTYKMQKMDFVKEGFNPSLHIDRVYFLEPSKSQYVLLTDNLYNDIISGNIRL